MCEPASFLAYVKIGDGEMVGAGPVIMKDVLEDTLVASIPAQVKKN
jgi:serine acetyltransferase